MSYFGKTTTAEYMFFGSCIAMIPLGIWKVIDIGVYIVNHLHWGLK